MAAVRKEQAKYAESGTSGVRDWLPLLASCAAVENELRAAGLLAPYTTDAALTGIARGGETVRKAIKRFEARWKRYRRVLIDEYKVAGLDLPAPGATSLTLEQQAATRAAIQRWMQEEKIDLSVDKSDFPLP